MASERKNHHYIPELLLRRFAAPPHPLSNPKDCQVLRIDKAGSCRAKGVSKLCSSNLFHGPEENGLEAAMGAPETEFGAVLKAIDRGEYLEPSSPKLSRLIWLHTVRTNVMRVGASNAFDGLMRGVLDGLASGEAGNFLAQETDDHFDEWAADALKEECAKRGVLPTRQQRRLLRKRTSVPGFKKQAVALVRHQATAVVPYVRSHFEQTSRSKSGVAKISEDAHIKALLRLVNERTVPEIFDTVKWSIKQLPNDSLLLGDCCAFAVSKDGVSQSVLHVDRAWAGLVLPISSSQAIIGLQPGHSLEFDADTINRSSAMCSLEYVFASKANEEILRHSSRIGTTAAFANADDLNKLFKDLWARP
jgi:hypothetical protein